MARYDDWAWAKAKTLWEDGASYRTANEETGIPVSTLRERCLNEGWSRTGPAADQTVEGRKAKTAAARAAAAAKVLERRGELAELLMEDLLELREQLFVPRTVKEAKVVPQGAQMGSLVEVVEIEVDRPSPKEQQAIVTSMAILTDKLLLLTGEATSRVENIGTAGRDAAEARLKMIRDDLEERRREKEAAAQAS